MQVKSRHAPRPPSVRGEVSCLPGDAGSGQSATEREDFPYRVEVWDRTGTNAKRVVAVAADSGVVYAALHAAAHDYPNRTAVLRDKSDPLPEAEWKEPPLEEEDVLPYHVELWRPDTDSPERTLARAWYEGLAHALFLAVTAEHPERRITLRKGNRMLADTMSMR
jgi:hypothetical protein